LKSKEDNFLIFNPDTLWNKDYIDEINKMQNFYFSNKLNNILLVSKKRIKF
jgi:MurNAc alpha-1-phosphate uridylyltransferase